MRPTLFPALAFAIASLLASASATPPAGYETFYAAPTTVNLGGRPVIAGISLHGDYAAAQRGDLRIALTTDVTDFIEETEQDLENWVASRQERCGQRWGAGEPFIGFPESAIRFAVDLELEVWQCGFDGKAEPGRLAREAGSVDVTLIPYIEDGRLQARLGDFSITERSGVSQYLPLEFVVRRVLDGELRKLNANPKFHRAPQPLLNEGLRYESIVADKTAEGRIVITARFIGRGDEKSFAKIARKAREEGVTQ